jgi:hypothetical protein
MRRFHIDWDLTMYKKETFYVKPFENKEFTSMIYCRSPSSSIRRLA